MHPEQRDARIYRSYMGNLNTHRIISQVDDHDVPIGVIDRASLPADHSNFRVVHMFVLDDAGRMLLQRIAPGSRSSGKWGSSAAGYVNAGESYMEACKRTVASELGLDIKPRLIGKTSMPDLGATKFIGLYQGHSSGPFHLDLTQVDMICFLPASEIETSLTQTPDKFTDTFHAVFGFYRSMRRN